MLKSTAGGGGIGMQLCHSAEELAAKFETVRSLGRNNFKDDGLFLEKFVAVARHIEVQIFGDGRGRVIALGERDCSTQRRNQKVIEETPAPVLNDELRAELCAAAVRLGGAVGYRSAGTVEFVFDADRRGVLFPRSEHAPAGGARRHRASHRTRSRGVDGAHRRGRAAGSRRLRACSRADTPSRSASTRKTRGRISSRAPDCSPRSPSPPACDAITGSARARKSRRSTIRCSRS